MNNKGDCGEELFSKKKKLWKLRYETRGRILKAEIFPELKFVLEDKAIQGSQQISCTDQKTTFICDKQEIFC